MANLKASNAQSCLSALQWTGADHLLILSGRQVVAPHPDTYSVTFKERVSRV